jgi:hypothetical protein
MLNVFVTSILILFTLAYIILAPLEARRVRDGRIGRTIVLGLSKKNLTLDHEQFLTRYRRQLGRTGWICVVIGVVILTVVFVCTLAWKADSSPWAFAEGGFFFLTGLVSVWCRRILSSVGPNTADAGRGGVRRTT